MSVNNNKNKYNKKSIWALLNAEPMPTGTFVS